MSTKIKGVLVGVSNYYMEGADDLEFCKNDVYAMKNALTNGLKADAANIVTCGLSGDVYMSDFIHLLKSFAITIDDEDILIFYFSGHGTTIDGEHFLVLSDGIIGTQEIIGFFENIKSKSKIVFLDCCMSGNHDVATSASFDIGKTIEEFHGKGYAVLSSSNATQYSFGHPEMPISVFTNFLCSAIQDKYIIREGRKSLFDIKKLIFLYLEVWNRRNPNILQNPVFRANMGGTILFEVENYEPYVSIDSYKEYDDFIIYEVEPSHHISAKRYAVKVILKNPYTLEEIANISQEVVQEVKKIEVYSNQISENRFQGKPANIIWVYFCRSESDIKHGNYICHTTWVDDSQDKEWWYKVDSKNRQFINDVHFNIHFNYQYLHDFIIENTDDKNKIVLEMQELLSMMITLAEKAVYQYNEFKNNTINECELVKILSPILEEIDDCFFKSTELEIADDSIHEWDEACTSLFASIHNFIYYYNEKYISSRTPENRVACIDMTIRDYYIALNKVKEFEGKRKRFNA